MANHCVEVICLDCGAEWCVRGCGYEASSSDVRLQRFLKEQQEWANKFAKGVVKHHMTHDKCRSCKSNKVCMN